MSQLGLSALEEDFFRAGEQLSDAGHHDFADLDEGFPQVTFWRAVVGWLRNERTARAE